MYDSKITAREFIDSLKEEADISITVPDSIYIRAINTTEQFIYTEILKEYVFEKLAYTDILDNKIPLNDITVPDRSDIPTFDDIIKVFADDLELERAGAVSVIDFPEKSLYYNKYDNNITLSFEYIPSDITVVYRLRPILKDSANLDSENIALPPEFIDLISSRVRGEIYKIVNEDGLSAKWLSDYNSQLENFKIWAMSRNLRFGG